MSAFTIDIKQTISDALRMYRGDNLERAAIAFKGLSPQEMHKQHGFSGKTRLQIFEEYQDHAERVEKALDWLAGTTDV